MEEKVKAVIDTSVYISAFMSKSKTNAPAKIMNKLCEGSFLAIVSPQILAEVIEISERHKTKTIEEITNFFLNVKNSIVKIKGDYISYKLDEIDIEDNILLGAALESKADYIISLDKYHVQPLKHYYGTQIIDPNYFLIELKTENAKRRKIKSIIFSN